MTEDEAKKKWCPFVRQIGHFADEGRFGPAVNRFADIDSEQTGHLMTCIASKCMAWEWAVVLWDGVPEIQETGDCGLKRNST